MNRFEQSDGVDEIKERCQIRERLPIKLLSIKSFEMADSFQSVLIVIIYIRKGRYR
jgi:hypothetical protein